MEKIFKNIISNIRREVGREKVILGVSGGIDSTVLALLMHIACPKNLYCLFVDSGLNRKQEKEKILHFFKIKKIKVKVINVKKEILDELKGKDKPQDKKNAIKKVFVNNFNLYSEKIGAKYIVHGTNKNDTELLFRRNKNFIKGTKIKNLEPFICITKNNIKKIAKHIGVPKEILNKYPLPSWGMSRKIIGEVNKEKIRYVLEADSILISKLLKYNFYNKCKNASAYLYPHYNIKEENEFFIILKIIENNNEWNKIPKKIISEAAKEICVKNLKISRVVLDITPDNFIEREWE